MKLLTEIYNVWRIYRKKKKYTHSRCGGPPLRAWSKMADARTRAGAARERQEEKTCFHGFILDLTFFFCSHTKCFPPLPGRQEQGRRIRGICNTQRFIVGIQLHSSDNDNDHDGNNENFDIKFNVRTSKQSHVLIQPAPLDKLSAACKPTAACFHYYHSYGYYD